MYGSVRCMCEHRTDPYVLENTRRIIRSLYVARTWSVRVPVMAVSAHTSSWPRTTAYVPSTGKKRCACTTFRHGLLTGIRGLCGLQNPVVLRAGPYGMPYDHPRVTGLLALTVPVNYPGAPCDLGISLDLLYVNATSHCFGKLQRLVTKYNIWSGSTRM